MNGYKLITRIKNIITNVRSHMDKATGKVLCYINFLMKRSINNNSLNFYVIRISINTFSEILM